MINWKGNTEVYFCWYRFLEFGKWQKKASMKMKTLLHMSKIFMCTIFASARLMLHNDLKIFLHAGVYVVGVY